MGKEKEEKLKSTPMPEPKAGKSKAQKPASEEETPAKDEQQKQLEELRKLVEKINKKVTEFVEKMLPGSSVISNMTSELSSAASAAGDDEEEKVEKQGKKSKKDGNEKEDNFKAKGLSEELGEVSPELGEAGEKIENSITKAVSSIKDSDGDMDEIIQSVQSAADEIGDVIKEYSSETEKKDSGAELDINKGADTETLESDSASNDEEMLESFKGYGAAASEHNQSQDAAPEPDLGPSAGAAPTKLP